MSRRNLINMTSEEIQSFLQEQRTLQVATIDHDGYPHLVAMWYILHEGKVVFWTYARSQKAVNLRRDPRLTCLAETGQRYEPLRVVFIRLEFLKPGQRLSGVCHALIEMSCCVLNVKGLAPVGVAFDLEDFLRLIQASIGHNDANVVQYRLGKLLQLRQAGCDLRTVAFGRLSVAELDREIVSVGV